MLFENAQVYKTFEKKLSFAMSEANTEDAKSLINNLTELPTQHFENLYSYLDGKNDEFPERCVIARNNKSVQECAEAIVNFIEADHINMDQRVMSKSFLRIETVPYNGTLVTHICLYGPDECYLWVSEDTGFTPEEQIKLHMAVSRFAYKCWGKKATFEEYEPAMFETENVVGVTCGKKTRYRNNKLVYFVKNDDDSFATFFMS